MAWNLVNEKSKIIVCDVNNQFYITDNNFENFDAHYPGIHLTGNDYQVIEDKKLNIVIIISEFEIFFLDFQTGNLKFKY